jgi:dienelactone hydrolase
MGHVEEIGFGEVVERGRAAAEGLSGELVYVGLSLGVLAAQMLVQTRPGARGAVLVHATVPASEFGTGWPEGVPLQIHTMEDDELGDVEVARTMVDEVEGAELFLYPGSRHLFTDRSTPDWDAESARLVTERVLAFLSSPASA